ncbi:MAG: hypothetical protein QM564_05240 [Bergeyella sp.]
MRTVKNLKNNRRVIFDTGVFDDWCVYIVEENGQRRAPFDVDYFTDLKRLNQKYGNNKVYMDFLKIYKITDHSINIEILNKIEEISETYKGEDVLLIEQWFSVIYAAMISEENKKNAILKKRVKHLGIYQALIQNFEPEKAAKFSYGKKWRELDALMREYDI